jgi:hypothetical protein
MYGIIGGSAFSTNPGAACIVSRNTHQQIRKLFNKQEEFADGWIQLNALTTSHYFANISHLHFKNINVSRSFVRAQWFQQLPIYSLLSSFTKQRPLNATISI